MKALISERRNTTNNIDRKRISKLIQKVTRRELRKWSCSELERVFQEFADLDRLDGIFRALVVCKHVKAEVEPAIFASLLRDVYVALNAEHVYDWQLIK